MINNVVLTGRLVATPELKNTPSGKYVTSFTIANDTGYGDSKRTNFINIVAWQKTAEFVTKYFKKGNAIGICGSIQTRQYDDKDGKKVYVTEVFANEIHFIESKKNDVQNENAPAEETQNNDFIPQEYADDDELPF